MNEAASSTIRSKAKEEHGEWRAGCLKRKEITRMYETVQSESKSSNIPLNHDEYRPRGAMDKEDKRRMLHVAVVSYAFEVGRYDGGDV